MMYYTQSHNPSSCKTNLPQILMSVYYTVYQSTSGYVQTHKKYFKSIRWEEKREV